MNIKHGMAQACLLIFFAASQTCAQYTITLTTEPPAERIVPDGGAVKFTLHVADKNGKPASFAGAKITMQSPRRGRFFSTDFPWVENSTLLELQSGLQNGNFSFRYLMPIRGTYSLDVEVKNAAGGEPFKKNFQIKVYENPHEMRRLCMLAALLFITGFAAGFTIQKSKRALAAAALALFLVPSSLHAHGHEHKHIEGNAKEIHTIQNASNILAVTLTPGHGTVGKTTRLDMTLTDLKKNIIRQPVYFEVQAVNDEDKVDVFHAVFFAHEGRTAQALQFSDGADHTVTVRAFLRNPEEKNAKPAASFSKTIEVETFQPPKKIVARTLTYLLLLIALGVIAGEITGPLFSGAAAKKA